MKNLKFLFIGIYFGIVLIKSEVISWFRIQEMFLFHSIHMYGIIGIAVITGMISVFLIKKFSVKSISGETINLDKKTGFPKAELFGGILFGFGWAITGACPGPLYALVGYGHYIMIIPLISAILGVFVYGIIKNKIPH